MGWSHLYLEEHRRGVQCIHQMHVGCNATVRWTIAANYWDAMVNKTRAQSKAIQAEEYRFVFFFGTGSEQRVDQDT